MRLILNSDSRLLVISPHPDDEALGVGGLIGKAIKVKAKILIVYMCVGSSRQLVTKKTNINDRLLEIKNVAKFTKSKVEIFYRGKEFTRLDTVAQKDIIEKIENVIENFKPSVIAIPQSTSYNQDHRATYTACITALRPTPKLVRHFTSTVLEYYEPYYWSIGNTNKPNTFLDLSEKFQKGNLLDFKLNLYRCHKTQVRKNPFARSEENLKHMAHVCGREVGVEIAESYHLLRTEIC